MIISARPANLRALLAKMTNWVLAGTGNPDHVYEQDVNIIYSTRYKVWTTFSKRATGGNTTRRYEYLVKV